MDRCLEPYVQFGKFRAVPYLRKVDSSGDYIDNRQCRAQGRWTPSQPLLHSADRIVAKSVFVGFDSRHHESLKDRCKIVVFPALLPLRRHYNLERVCR